MAHLCIAYCVADSDFVSNSTYRVTHVTSDSCNLISSALSSHQFESALCMHRANREMHINGLNKRV